MSRRRATQVIVWTVIAAGAGILVWAVPGALRFAFADAPRGGFWAMTAAAIIVDIPLFGITRRDSLRVRSTLSVCFTFAIFVLWGPAPAIVVQALAGAVTVIGQRYLPTAGLYFVARLICALLGAELFVTFLDPRPITHVGEGLNGGDLLAFAALGTVWLAISYGLLVVARSAFSGEGLRRATADIRYDVISTAALVLVVSPLLATIAGWWKILIVLPLLIWNQLNREQQRHEQRLAREPESGLLNRQGLDVGIRAITAMDVVQPGQLRPFAVVVLNADSLLTINRTLGREMFERVVALTSQRFINAYGPDRVARLSGEGTAIVIPDLTEDNAVERAEAAVNLLGERIDVDGVPFTLDAVAGVSLSPEHGRDLGTLLAKAELAASEARRQGLRAMIYMRAAATVTRRRIEMLRDLRSTLHDPAHHHELAVLYQPQVDVNTGRLIGVEALLRWTHPEWGPVRTDELIEAIEPSEVMHMLTRHMLERVAAQLRRWNDLGQPVRAAVNVSVQDLHEPDFVEELGAMIERHGISPTQLTIEITERLLIVDTQRVAQVAARLSRLGVGLSLDDFGTGYASLQQLRLLPLTEVKIDGSYVKGIVQNPADLAIVRSVYQLARALRVAVVAEGVEDQRTAWVLGDLAGTIGQGYFFGRPMPAEALRDWHYAPQARPRRRLRLRRVA